MADFSAVSEAGRNEEMIIHRGLVVLAGLLAGAGFASTLMAQLPGPILAGGGVVGGLALGRVPANEVATALAMVAGGVLGVLASQMLWLLLAQGQKQLASLPVADALKRATVPFGVFLPLITILAAGGKPGIQAVMVFAGLAAGLMLLAFFEKKDKRKIFFAHPTEPDYHPGALFTHGGMIALGVGIGWYYQSLPGAHAALGGLWVALGFGTVFWLAALLLAGALSLFFSKQTFDQVFAALALASLPLAVLPLQTIGGFHYAAAEGGISWPWLPYVLAALAGSGTLAVLLILLMKLRRRPIETHLAWDELFQALMLITAIPLLIYAAAFWPAGSPVSQSHLAGALDFFHEGESLSAAQAVLLDRLPFKEILLRHGFGTDALGGIVAIQWFGHTVLAYRWLLALLAPLGLVALYLLAIFCLPWIWALLLTLLVMAGGLGAFPDAGLVLPVIGFIFTLFFIQRGRWVILIFSGLFTALAMIASFTAGLTALAGTGVLLVFYLGFGSGVLKNRLIHFGLYLAATLLSLVPWMVYLTLSGNAGAYFQNFAWVLNHFSALFSLPLPGWGPHPTMSQIVLFVFPPVVIILGVLSLANALLTARENGLPWNVLLLTVFSFILWYRFLLRTNDIFLAQALPVAGLLAAFFVFRATARQRRLRGAVFLALLPVFLIAQPGRLDLTTLAGGFGAKNSVPMEAGVQSDVKNVGPVIIPAEQQKWVRELTDYLDGQVGTTETYYDFSNQPLLYFLIPRKPPVSALATATLATQKQQAEAIRALEQAEVKAVIWNGRTALEDGLDGIPSEIRQTTVAEYLLKRFVPVKRIGGTVVLVPAGEGVDPDPEAKAALIKSYTLDELPWRWGLEQKYDPTQGRRAGIFEPMKNLKVFEAAGLTVTAKGDGVAAAPASVPMALDLTRTATAGDGDVLVLELAVLPELNGQEAQLAWGKPEEGPVLAFRLKSAPRAVRYVFRLAALPAWVFAGPVERLTLRLPGGGWSFERAVLLKASEP